MLTIILNLKAKVMANKRKCLTCKEYDYPKKGIVCNVGFFCCDDCRRDYAFKKTVKQIAKAKVNQEKENKRAVTELNRKTLKWQHAATQPVFNKLRRLQEFKWFKDRDIEPYCISCRKTKMDWCNGHFKTVGSTLRLAYDVKNSYLQCNTHCNKHKSGNIENYKLGLISRFGKEKAQEIMSYCEENTHSIKYHWQDLEDMRKEFNAEIRQLEKELL